VPSLSTLPQTSKFPAKLNSHRNCPMLNSFPKLFTMTITIILEMRIHCRWPLSSWCWVAASKSEPNCAKAATCSGSKVGHRMILRQKHNNSMARWMWCHGKDEEKESCCGIWFWSKAISHFWKRSCHWLVHRDHKEVWTTTGGRPNDGPTQKDGMIKVMVTIIPKIRGSQVKPNSGQVIWLWIPKLLVYRWMFNSLHLVLPAW